MYPNTFNKSKYLIYSICAHRLMSYHLIQVPWDRYWWKNWIWCNKRQCPDFKEKYEKKKFNEDRCEEKLSPYFNINNLDRQDWIRFHLKIDENFNPLTHGRFFRHITHIEKRFLAPTHGLPYNVSVLRMLGLKTKCGKKITTICLYGGPRGSQKYNDI